MKESRQATVSRLATSPLLVTRECIINAYPDEASAPYAPAHYEIERRYLDYSTTFLNLVAPRGMAKSTIVAGGCALHHLFFEDIHRFNMLSVEERTKLGQPTISRKHVVLISKVQKEAKKRLTTIKNILGNHDTGQNSPFFVRLFGDYGQRTSRKWTEDQIVLANGSIITAIGTGQSVRGLNESGLRPTLILVDDPEDEQNTRTVEAMVSNMKWLFQAVRPALDRQKGRLVVIGTPQNMQSMVVRLHDSFAGGKALFDTSKEGRSVRADSVWFQNYPDVENTLGLMGENRTSVKPGESVFVDELSGERIEEDDDGSRWVIRPGLLWPEWIDAESLEEEKRLCITTEGVGVGVFYREWCCLVVGDEEQVFGPELFNQTYRGHLVKDPTGRKLHTLVITHKRGVELVPPEEHIVYVSTGIDPAFSTSSTADRTAIANVATNIDDEIHELPGVYKRLHPSALLGSIALNDDLKQPRRGLMEVTAAQVFVATQLQEQKGIRYIHDRPRVKKKGVGSRIASLEPYMRPATEGANGKFWHMEKSPLKAELLSYPRGKDDYADAMEKAVRCRMKPDVRTPSDKKAYEDEWLTDESVMDPLVV